MCCFGVVTFYNFTVYIFAIDSLALHELTLDGLACCGGFDLATIEGLLPVPDRNRDRDLIGCAQLDRNLWPLNRRRRDGGGIAVTEQIGQQRITESLECNKSSDPGKDGYRDDHRPHTQRKSAGWFRNCYGGLRRNGRNRNHLIGFGA
ncbi:MAG: hypothetical protein JRG70_11300 [Deltaproteobacteria bacterium]|nr:hypothetical protein [Deltaproteobacteria bacterium]